MPFKMALRARRGISRALFLAAILATRGAVLLADAPTPTSIEVVRGEIARRCHRTSAPSVVGPWADRGTTFWAGLAWDEGDHVACLALVRGNPGRAHSVATHTICAGASERYQEWYAPVLRVQPLRLDGQAPMPITDATSMGVGGGGGTVTTVWRFTRGAWSEVVQTTLDGSININTLVEHPCGAPGEFASDGRIVTAESCFEGQTRTLRWVWRNARLEPATDP
ncbi:MAG: hypothetical protein WCJ30_00050 [Deltaproteobacteria bacterium]